MKQLAFFHSASLIACTISIGLTACDRPKPQSVVNSPTLKFDLVAGVPGKVAIQVFRQGEAEPITITLPLPNGGSADGIVATTIARNGTFACLGPGLLGAGKINPVDYTLTSFEWFKDIQPHSFHLAINPSGTKVAYARHGGGQLNFRGEIHIVDLETGEDTKTNAIGEDSVLLWTAEGQHILYSDAVRKEDIDPKDWDRLPHTLTVYDEAPVIHSVNINDQSITRFFPGFPAASDSDGAIQALSFAENTMAPAGAVEFRIDQPKATVSRYSINVYPWEGLVVQNPVLYWKHNGEIVYIHKDSSFPIESETGTYAVYLDDGHTDSKLAQVTVDRQTSISLSIWAH